MSISKYFRDEAGWQKNNTARLKLPLDMVPNDSILTKTITRKKFYDRLTFGVVRQLLAKQKKFMLRPNYNKGSAD